MPGARARRSCTWRTTACRAGRPRRSACASRRRARACSRCAAGSSGSAPRARRRTSPTNTAVRDVVMPGLTGAPDRAEERDVDRPVGQLRVEPGDDVALRARELELHLRPRHRSARGTTTHGPATGTHDLQPAALVRRARAGRRRARARRATTSGGEQHERLTRSSGTRASTAPPPASSSATAPPAKTSVISRTSASCRGASRGSRRPPSAAASFVAVKNWPPVARAIGCSVFGVGGTWIRSVKPPVSLCCTTPFGVPTSDGVDGDVQLRAPAGPRPPASSGRLCGAVGDHEHRGRRP